MGLGGNNQGPCPCRSEELAAGQSFPACTLMPVIITAHNLLLLHAKVLRNARHDNLSDTLREEKGIISVIAADKHTVSQD